MEHTYSSHLHWTLFGKIFNIVPSPEVLREVLRVDTVDKWTPLPPEPQLCGTFSVWGAKKEDNLENLSTFPLLFSAFLNGTSLHRYRQCKANVGDRAFPVAAARVWNELPRHVTSAPSQPRVFCSRQNVTFAAVLLLKFCSVCELKFGAHSQAQQ